MEEKYPVEIFEHGFEVHIDLMKEGIVYLFDFNNTQYCVFKTDNGVGVYESTELEIEEE